MSTNIMDVSSLLQNCDPVQASMMDERVILTDRDDNVIGHASKVESHLMEFGPILHRAFSVFVFDAEGRMLLQQRASEKVTFPDLWTNTCCSHPLFCTDELGFSTAEGAPVPAPPRGFTFSELMRGSATGLLAGHEMDSVLGAKRAVIRKLRHELGLDLPGGIESLAFMTKVHYRARSAGRWGEHEVDYVFLAKLGEKNVNGQLSLSPLDPNPNEVRAVKFVSQEELAAFVNQPDVKFTPWSKLIIERLMGGWWQLLSSGASAKEVEARLAAPSTIHRLGEGADELAVLDTSAVADACRGDESVTKGTEGAVMVDRLRSMNNTTAAGMA